MLRRDFQSTDGSLGRGNGSGRAGGFAQQHQQKQQQQESLYEFKDVEIKYGDSSALAGVNLSIKYGEFVFITGPSGAGKSTLLKSFAGLVPVHQGQIKGPCMNDKDKGPFVSMVFQELNLIDDFTCEDNLHAAFDPQIYSSKEQFLHDLKEYCQYFNITPKLKNKIKDVNGGLRQKTAIVRSLLARPQVLLADEPTSALDKENTVRLFELLCYLNKNNKITVIWASHNKELIKQFNCRIIHLEMGRLIYMGHACFI